jgi:hypothetical protein
MTDPERAVEMRSSILSDMSAPDLLNALPDGIYITVPEQRRSKISVRQPAAIDVEGLAGDKAGAVR